MKPSDVFKPFDLRLIAFAGLHLNQIVRAQVFAFAFKPSGIPCVLTAARTTVIQNPLSAYLAWPTLH